MAFQNGHKYSKGGRRKGSMNKPRRTFMETLATHNFDIAETFLELYSLARKDYDNAIDDTVKATALTTSVNIVEKIASYSMPKLKSVEHTVNNPLANMSDQEKIKALKQAVSLLENKEKEAEVIEIEHHD